MVYEKVEIMPKIEFQGGITHEKLSIRAVFSIYLRQDPCALQEEGC